VNSESGSKNVVNETGDCIIHLNHNHIILHKSKTLLSMEPSSQIKIRPRRIHCSTISFPSRTDPTCFYSAISTVNVPTSKSITAPLVSLLFAQFLISQFKSATQAVLPIYHGLLDLFCCVTIPHRLLSSPNLRLHPEAM
jgi:hypothetical protein